MDKETEEVFDEILKTFGSVLNAVRFLVGWCTLLTAGLVWALVQ